MNKQCTWSLTAKGTDIHLKENWDIKIGSARELFRTLHDYLDKYEYEHHYAPMNGIVKF